MRKKNEKKKRLQNKQQSFNDLTVDTQTLLTLATHNYCLYWLLCVTFQ